MLAQASMQILVSSKLSTSSSFFRVESRIGFYDEGNQLLSGPSSVIDRIFGRSSCVYEPTSSYFSVTHPSGRGWDQDCSDPGRWGRSLDLVILNKNPPRVSGDFWLFLSNIR